MRTLVAFLVLTSTLLLLGRGVPIPDPSVLEKLTNNSGGGETSETLNTVSVTTIGTTAPPPTPGQSHDREEVSEAEKVDDKPSTETKREEAPRVKSPKFLLYEVEKGIGNLSLQAIETVLSLDSEVFSYSLADALGYLKNQNEDDPHVKVIEDNKEILLTKLKDKKEKLKPSVKPPPPTTAPPPPPETPPPVNVGRIEYDIVKNISKLTVDRIDSLLNTYDVHALPFALGMEFGYDDERNVEHFQYLEDEGGEILKKVLLKEKEKKLTKPHLIPSENTKVTEVNNAKKPTVDDLPLGEKAIKPKKTNDNEVEGQEPGVGVSSHGEGIKPKKTNDNEPGGQEEEGEGTARKGEGDNQHPAPNDSNDLPEEEGEGYPDYVEDTFRVNNGERTGRVDENNEGSNHPPDDDGDNSDGVANEGGKGTNAGKVSGLGVDGHINKGKDGGGGDHGGEEKDGGGGNHGGKEKDDGDDHAGEEKDGGGDDHGGEEKGDGDDHAGEGKDGGGDDHGGDGGEHREEAKDEGQGTMYKVYIKLHCTCVSLIVHVHVHVHVHIHARVHGNVHVQTCRICGALV